MDLNGAVSISGGLCCWSPNGRYLAVVASRSRLVIRDSSDLQVIRSEAVIFSAAESSQNSDLNTIQKIQFSPDSEFILATNFKLGITLIFRVLHSDWKGKITEGLGGLVDIMFTPDSRHLISFAEFSVKLTIWSLIEKRVRYIKFPKTKDCVEFSHDGTFLGVVETRNGKDCISLFSCEDWNVYHHFELDFDNSPTGCGGIKWSPTSDSMCVLSDHLDYECHVYSIPSGQRLMCYKADRNTFGMGVRSCCWSQCGKLLAIGGGDSKLRLFNCVNWSLMTELDVNHCIRKEDNASVYEEKEVCLNEVDIDLRIAKELTSKRLETEYVSIYKRPVQVATTKSMKVSKICYGITEMKFSPNGLYLYVHSDSMPTAAFVFDVMNLKLDTVLAHRHPIVKCDWGPEREKNQLMILTMDDGMLHAFTTHGVVCLGLPSIDRDYQAHDMMWNPKGKAVALVGKNSVVCCRVGTKHSES